MKVLQAFLSSQRTFFIALSAVVSLSHVSQGWCNEPAVNCVQLSIDLKAAKQVLAAFMEGLASLRTEQHEYEVKLDELWDRKIAGETLTADQLAEEDRLHKNWSALQHEINLLWNDILGQENIIKALEKDNRTWCTGFASQPRKKPFSTRAREGLI